MSRAPASGGVRLSRAQQVDWLRLIRAENVGPSTFRTLLNQYGSAAAALEALPDLARRGGGRSLRIPTADEAAREIERTESIGARFVAAGEDGYPKALRTIPSAPPLLAVLGDAAALAQPAVAIVGSRNASTAGARMADRIARGLSDKGYAVVSGLARGIDAAAHRAALAGGTVAVVAGGVDHVYPEENRALRAEMIAAGGAVVSEMPFGWVPRAQDFPRRNRIVSGMAAALVVVEATGRSGTLHTVRFALDQGRDVLAVPGSPLDPRAEGTNRLIRDGARLVRSAEDVIEELEPALRRLGDADGLSDPEDGAAADGVDARARALVLSALGPVPVAVDDIALHTGLPTRTVAALLVELAVEGAVERHANGLVSRTP